MRTQCVLLVLVAAGCAPAHPGSRGPAEPARAPVEDADTVVTTRETVITSEEISPAELAKIREGESRARRAARLVATDTLRLRVGQVVRTESLPLTMLDTAGADLGRLPGYDYELGPERVVAVADGGFRGERAGTGTITFSISQVYRGDAGPVRSAVLHVQVRD